jgi:tetratricopeptide (TPR) repeat protein
VRELLRAGGVGSAHDEVSRFIEAQSDPARRAGALAVQLAIEIAAGTSEQWHLLARLVQLVHDDSLTLWSVEERLRFFSRAHSNDAAVNICVGVLAHRAGRHDQARSLLDLVRPSDRYQEYLTSATLARSALALGDEQTALTALSAAYEATGDPTIERFAESVAIFDPPATAVWLGLELTRALRQRQKLTEALQVLDQLRGRHPRDSEIARLHAEVVGQSGGRGEALRDLEKLLVVQEREHDDIGAARTLESMIRIAPGNLSLLNRLVEAYLRRGRFVEAIELLVIQGRVLHHAGRIQDALVPMRRAIEIATMVGDWNRVEKLHLLMIEFDPDDTSIRHAAVTTYVQYGKTDQALRLLREIVNIAVVNEDPDQAIAALHQMLALAPNEPSTFHRLGELLASIGGYSQAERVYRRLATLVPDDPAVRAKRQALAAMARPQT